MDDGTRRRIEERARALWERDGRPEGGLNPYLAQAEDEEVGSHISVAGEEDPQVGLDHDAPGGAAEPKPGA